MVYRGIKVTNNMVNANHFNPMPAVTKVPKASRFFDTNGKNSEEIFHPVTSSVGRDENGVRSTAPSGFGSFGLQNPNERDVRPVTSSAGLVAEKSEASEDSTDSKSEPESKPLYQRSSSSNFRLLLPDIRRPMTRSR